MNRKIKYLFFLVIFITVNTTILILAVLGCILLSEFVFGRILAFLPGSTYILGLLSGIAISVLCYRKLYHYSESKWYIHRLFDFSRYDSWDL